MRGDRECPATLVFDRALLTLALGILSASLETKGLEAPVTGEQEIRQSLARLLAARLLCLDDIGSEEGVAVASACGAKVNGHGHDGLVGENALAREVGGRTCRPLSAHHGQWQPAPCTRPRCCRVHSSPTPTDAAKWVTITREPRRGLGRMWRGRVAACPFKDAQWSPTQRVPQV